MTVHHRPPVSIKRMLSGLSVQSRSYRIRHLSAAALLGLAALFAGSCDLQAVSDPDPKSQAAHETEHPGALSFQHLPESAEEPMAGENVLAGRSPNALKVHFFLLQNLGDAPVENIQFKSNHPDVRISPARIGSLLPGREWKIPFVVRVIISTPETRMGELKVAVSGMTRGRDGESLPVQIEDILMSGQNTGDVKRVGAATRSRGEGLARQMVALK